MRSVVLITVDCLRSDHLGCYGYDRPTSPNIDRFATNATLYENSYANCPGTRWAFQSLHTGFSTIRIDGLGIPESSKPLAAHLSDGGYVTGGFAVNGFVSRDYRYNVGFDRFYSVNDSRKSEGMLRRIGGRIDDFVSSEFIRDTVLRPVHEWLRSTETDDENRFQPSYSDADTVDRVLSFMDEHRDDPYFLWVHLMDAHTPYGYWPKHLRALRGDADLEHTIHPGKEGKVHQGRDPPEEVIDTYDAGIRSADEQIGRLLGARPDDATVVITGDHGEEFGRYGGFHNRSLYSSMTQVPIIVRDPELDSGRIQTPAQHLDIPPTLLHAAEIGVPDQWEGVPLQTCDRTIDDPIFYTFDFEEIAVRTGEWKYIQSSNTEELFRVPHHGSEEEPTTNEDKRNELRILVKDYKTTDTAAGNGRSELDGENDLSQEVEDNLEELGYL